MTFILSFVMKFLGGGILNKVLSHLQQRAETEVERDRIASEVAIEHVKAEVASRQAAAEIVKAEQGWWVTAMIRPLFAIPLGLYWAKILIWDKMLGWGTTDPLTGTHIPEWAGWIVGAYFVTRPFEKIGRSYIRGKR